MGVSPPLIRTAWPPARTSTRRNATSVEPPFTTPIRLARTFTSSSSTFALGVESAAAVEPTPSARTQAESHAEARVAAALTERGGGEEAVWIGVGIGAAVLAVAAVVIGVLFGTSGDAARPLGSPTLELAP